MYSVFLLAAPRRATRPCQAFTNKTALLSKPCPTTSPTPGRKDQLVEHLHMRLETQPLTATKVPDETAETSSKAKILRMKILNKNGWLRFCEQFDVLFSDLLDRLKTQFPDLTASEQRLFMLQKLQFEVAQIAEILGISPGSVWQGRQRLTKKLGLHSTVEVEHFVGLFSQS